MLTADAQPEVRTGLAAQLDAHLNELADALLVQMGKGIALVDLVLIVIVEELTGVITAETEGHLGQVVGAEGEEVSLGGDLIGGQGSTGDLDHGADLILHVHTGLGDQLIGGLHYDVLNELQLLHLAYQRDHDVRSDHIAQLLGSGDGSLDHSGGLHLGDLGEGNSQTAAAVTHHGVELMQRGDNGLQLVHGDVQLARDLHDILLLGGQELVQRRIEVTDGHGTLAHYHIHRLKVALLIRLDLGQCGTALLYGAGNDHLTDGLDAVALEEHVLGTAQTDALCTELNSLLGVTGVIGIGKYLQTAHAVGPAHKAAEVAGNGGVGGGDGFAVDAAGGAVQRDPVALTVGLAAQGELLLIIVYVDLAAAGNAAGAHAAGYCGGVAGHTAAHGQDALCNHHALDVLGGGLQTNEDDLLHGAAFHGVLGVLGGEYHLAAGSAGGGSQTLADHFGLLHGVSVELGMQQAVQLLRLYTQYRFLLGDHALVHEVNGDLQGGGSGALAVTGLQHIQLTVLNGELHILHVTVMLLQAGGNVHKLLIDLGHLLGQLADGRGSTDTGYHVLALRIDEVLAEQRLLTGGGVAGKGYAGAAGVAAVAEGHRLYVNGGAPVIGDLVHAAVDVGAGVIPAAEYGLDRLDELNLGVLGEVLTLFVLIELLEAGDQLLHILGVQVHVVLNALLLLQLVDDLLEALLGKLHHYVGEHLDEAAIAVVSKTGVIGLLGKTLYGFIVQAEVQDGIHHAGHGGTGAGTDGNQQGAFHIAELLADLLFQLLQIHKDIGHDILVDLAAVGVVLGAGLGGDGKAGGHGHTGVGHLGQIGALTAQQLTHVLVALFKHIEVLFLAAFRSVFFPKHFASPPWIY